MLSLIVDQTNRVCCLFENHELICSQFEDRFSRNSKDIVFSIKRLLDECDLQFSHINNFIYIGKDVQRFNAILNLNLLDDYDHLNRKEIIKMDKEESELFFLIKKYNLKKAAAVVWEIDYVEVYLLDDGKLKKALFDVDEDNSIKDYFKILKNEVSKDLITRLTIASFLGDLSLYDEIKKECLIFEPDGRFNLNRDSLIKWINDFKDDPRLIYSLKKITDDILIHVFNYIRFLTKENNLIISGKIPSISLAYGKMQEYIPFERAFYELKKESSSTCRGALEKLFYDKGKENSFEEDEKEIASLVKGLFSDFHSEKLENISKYFYYMDDDVLVMIKDYLEKCDRIKINFSHRNTVISSSGVKAWSRLYFYFFARFKESGYPVILNYNVMAFFKKNSGLWEIADLEFYSSNNLPILTLELSNSCNYKCIMCDTNRHRKKAFMSFETFKNVIDSLEGFKVGTITPFWLGEPLLNPDFENMIDYAFEKNQDNKRFISFTINTNASLLDKSKTEAVLRNAKRKGMNENTFIRIHFSLDSNDPDTYRKIHGAGNLNKVKENIKYFLKRRKEEGLNYPKITLALIVMKENFDEVRDFVDHWSDVLENYGVDYYKTWDWPWLEKDAIYLRRLDCSEQDEAEKMHFSVIESLNFFKEESGVEFQETVEQITVNSEKKDEEPQTTDHKPKTDEQIKDNNGRILNTDSVLIKENMDFFIRRPCPALWKTPIVNTDGEVTVCCFDIDLSLRIGNINERDLKEIWNGDTINSWRNFHLRGDFNRVDRCSRCHNINSPTMKNSEFIEYLLDKDDITEIEKAHFLN
ncbi:MAG: hypothetical protein C0601_11220 [Candidatus Muiribacterium halophilum]|uniref:Radical SAM core domain-containing protein n=1 Tax=Muiribacterium halophilum TaxID=2053465 RepID=A0A2N5ZC65_MUIH1|nr:MAG: hypothetical protein C0601_11220 [Candidatus Muirbacterium halophilum]